MKSNFDHIADVVDRYESATGGLYSTRMTVFLDLDYADKQFHIDWPAMLAGRDVDLVHDVAGIARHMARRTGVVGGCFAPRYHRAEGGAE